MRSYLHVNCAHCHRQGGGGTAYIELQEELPIEATKALDVRPTQGTFDISDARILAPGDPYRSTLFYRIAKTGSGRMPHIGSETVDPQAVDAVHAWIRQLPIRSEEAAKLRELRSLVDDRPLPDEVKNNPIAYPSAEILANTETFNVLPEELNTCLLYTSPSPRD